MLRTARAGGGYAPLCMVNPRTDWDVLVVGGGPAGLSAAAAAAAAGARTLLVERNAEIGTPIRTSGASWLTDLDELGIPRALAHPVETVRIVGPGSQVAWTFSSPRACVLDVRGLYQHLAGQAIEAGTHVRLRHAVTEPLMEDGRVVGVTLRDDQGRTDIVRAVVTVDASGSAAVLGARAGLHRPFARVGVGAEYDLLAPGFNQGQATLLVGRDLAPHGYAWAFPRGAGRVRVGVGILRPHSHLDPRALLGRLLSHPAFNGTLADAQPIEYHVGVLPAESPATVRLSGLGLLLAGDSATQASPLLGEGIRYAIRAGRLAGQAAAAAAANPLGSLTGYDRAWGRRFGSEMDVSYWLSRRFARYGDRNWRVVVALLGCLSPEQLAAGLHGDYTLGWWLRLGIAAPRLAAAAVKARWGPA